MKHLVYITNNLINNKQYIGDHTTKNINDSYLGSGLLIKKAIKKYGKENFQKEILKICKTKKEAFDKQKKYIKEYNTLIPNGYNISPKGGHNVKGCFSDESKKKISDSLKKTYKNNPELAENIRRKITGRKLSEEIKKSLKGRKSHRKGLLLKEEYGDKSEEIRKKLKKPKSKEHRKKLSEAKKGIPMSEETKRKISQTTKGNKIISIETRKKLSNSLKGRIFSEETKNKMSKAKKGNRKLNNFQIKEIKEKLNYMKMQDIANDYNVQRNLIYKIKNNKYKQY